MEGNVKLKLHIAQSFSNMAVHSKFDLGAMRNAIGIMKIMNLDVCIFQALIPKKNIYIRNFYKMQMQNSLSALNKLK